MISEREFSTYFSSFWRDALPNLESAVRSLNLATETKWPQIVQRTDSSRRDLVAETSFEIAATRFGAECRSYGEIFATSEIKARSFLNSLNRGRSLDSDSITADESSEINAAQARIFTFASNLRHQGAVQFHPRFAGHGFLGECMGDLRSASSIVEIKYVQRNFCSNDYKQALTYVALAYLCDEATINDIILLNPYRGLISLVPLQDLVRISGGINFEEFCDQLSHCVSSGEVSR